MSGSCKWERRGHRTPLDAMAPAGEPPRLLPSGEVAKSNDATVLRSDVNIGQCSYSDLEQRWLVFARVVPAEQQFTAREQHGSGLRAGSAAVAAIECGERRWLGGVRGCDGCFGGGHRSLLRVVVRRRAVGPGRW